MTTNRDINALIEQNQKGWTNLNLQQFIGLLHQAYDFPSDSGFLDFFYLLVEKHGLVIHDRVIDGSEVCTSNLLETLRKREKEQEQALSNNEQWEYFEFWESLSKEAKYLVGRDEVATAFRNKGEESFPWYDLTCTKFDWLPITTTTEPLIKVGRQSKNELRDVEYKKWMDETKPKPKIENMHKSEIKDELMRRNPRLWSSGFGDWWKYRKDLKGKHGRRKGK